ncbi:MAG: DUF4190 domain-containing protein [Flavobacteriales bacterium]|nr:DUF4190 domain-containing protein [Flavobacteriales bacterium]
MKKTVALVSISLLFLSLFSCSIHKPLYTKGMWIEWWAGSTAPRTKTLNESDKISLMNSSEIVHLNFSEEPRLEAPLEASGTTRPTVHPFDNALDEHSQSKTSILESGTSKHQEVFQRRKNKTFNIQEKTDLVVSEKTTLSPPVNLFKANSGPGGKKLEIMSLLSMIFSISGLIIPYLGFALIVAGLVLGILGLLKIKKNPEEYWGRGFAIAGISVAGFAILLFLLLLGLVGSLFLLGAL